MNERTQKRLWRVVPHIGSLFMWVGFGLVTFGFWKHAAAEADCTEGCAPRVRAWAVGHCYCLEAGCWVGPERALVSATTTTREP